MSLHQDDKWVSSQGPNGCLEHHTEKDSNVKSGLRGKHDDCPVMSVMEREKGKHGCQLFADPDYGSMLKVYK